MFEGPEAGRAQVLDKALPPKSPAMPSPSYWVCGNVSPSGQDALILTSLLCSCGVGGASKGLGGKYFLVLKTQQDFSCILGPTISLSHNQNFLI